LKTLKDVSAGPEYFIASMMSKYKKPFPSGINESITVKAEINHGRWIVKCPWCSGAELADKDDRRFFCLSCFNKAINGKFIKVEFPNKAIDIETILKVRPAKNQNWTPGETIAQLKNENKGAGL